MITIMHPEYRWISCLIIMGYGVFRLIIHNLNHGYKIPPSAIHPTRYIIRNLCIFTSILLLSLIPLDLTYTSNKPSHLIIVLDSSISMLSEDINPTRLHIAEQVINKLNGNHTITYCYSQSPVSICPNPIIIPNSGSSVSDMLAIAIYSSSQSDILEKYHFLVISDGGINNGISFDTLFITGKNYDNVLRLDLYPQENVVISGSIIAKQKLLQDLPPIKNYIISRKDEDINTIYKKLEGIIGGNSNHSLNPLLIVFIGLLVGFLGFGLSQSFKKIN